MRFPRFVLAALVLFVLMPSMLHAQDPPYQTDDPVPVDYKHYEFYIFGNTDGTPVQVDSTGQRLNSIGVRSLGFSSTLFSLGAPSIRRTTRVRLA